jgi:5-methylcytosine-specific restriction endonuclease McrA
MTRSEAKQVGAKHYDEGVRPCPKGHLPVLRQTSNGACVACAREYAAHIRATDPDRPKRHKAVYRGKYPERVLQQARETYERRKAAANANHQKWLAANPHKRRTYEAKRRALKQQSTSEHYTTEDIERLIEAQRWRCIYCGKSIRKKFHVDHIVPLSKGGDNSPRNIQLLCQTCNQRKFTRDPFRFAMSLGRLL